MNIKLLFQKEIIDAAKRKNVSKTCDILIELLRKKN
jgi:hypothetical protein